jgi:hypothetical protein
MRNPIQDWKSKFSRNDRENLPDETRNVERRKEAAKQI